MMDHSPEQHLTYDDLMHTLVDLSDLDAGRQAHLKSCYRCRREADKLSMRYNRLGRMARNTAPEPSRPFRLASGTQPARRWQFKPAVALGIVGALIFVFTLWLPRFTEHAGTPAPMVARNFEDDDRLMEEIDALVDDALPGVYQQLASLSENQSVEDLDELIDWVVPTLEDDDDTEPRTSDPEFLERPLARSGMKINAEEGMV